MNYIKFTPLLKLFILISLVSLMNSCKKSIRGEKPNIIIILADDMGYGNVEILNKESRILYRDGWQMASGH